MSAETPLFDLADFELAPRICCLSTAGEPPLLKSHRDRYAAYATDKALGYRGRSKMAAEVEAVRDRAARLFSVPRDCMGFCSSVAEGMSMLAESLPLKSGDSVVVQAPEYPSVVIPFQLIARQKGFTLKIAANEAEVADLADETTRLIAVSWVSYIDARVCDLARMRRIADLSGAALAVDFTQASGYKPIDAGITDFAFSATYKWLLGTPGVALTYWNRARQPDWLPATGGWHTLAPDPQGRHPDYASIPPLKADAMLFCRGNPAHLPIYLLGHSLDYLAGFGIDRIGAHVAALTGDLHKRLTALGLSVLTPSEPARRGGSVSFATPESDRIADALAERNIHVWGGRDRVRISIHGFNCHADISRLAEALAAIIRAG